MKFTSEDKPAPIPGNHDECVGEQVCNQVEVSKPMMKSSTRAKKAPGRSEHYAMMAVEDLVPWKEAKESCDREHCKQGATE